MANIRSGDMTPSLVNQWEHGEEKPQGAPPKLLSFVETKGLGIVS